MKEKNIINKSTTVRRNQNIDASDLNNEKVMMNLEKGKYFALNEVGSKIWDIIEKPILVGNIVNMLISEYEIDEADCQRSVIEFLGKMSDAELIYII